jgi:WD40 repeat protein
MTVGADRRSVVLGLARETLLTDGLTGTLVRRVGVPDGRAVSPDGRTLLVADGYDVAVWDLATGTQRGLARHHTGAVQAIAWAADGSTFATTSDDRTTIVWDAGTLRSVEVFSGPPGRQVQVGYSIDGRSLFTAGQDGCVYLWDLTGSRREETLLDPAGPYAGGKIDPQNATAVFDAQRNRAVVTEGDLAYLVDVSTGKPVGAAFPLGAALHQWPDLDARGTRMAMGLADGRGRVWDVESRKLLLDVRVAQPEDRTTWSYVNAGLSGDGRTVAFATYLLPPVNRTEITFYDVDTGQKTSPTWRIEGAAANRFGASPDGRYLVATTAAGFAAVWDLRDKREVARLQQPAKGSAMLARFSRDGRYLAVGTGTGRPTLWRVSDWSMVWEAEAGHNGYDVSMSFSPNGTVLASSGSDSKIFLYDVRTGEMLGEAFGPDRNSWLYAEFRADRNEIVGYFDDGSMARWDVDPASQVRVACQIAGRELTQAEWEKLVPGRPYQPICPQ